MLAFFPLFCQLEEQNASPINTIPQRIQIWDFIVFTKGVNSTISQLYMIWTVLPKEKLENIYEILPTSPKLSYSEQSVLYMPCPHLIGSYKANSHPSPDFIVHIKVLSLYFALK